MAVSPGLVPISSSLVEYEHEKVPARYRTVHYRFGRHVEMPQQQTRRSRHRILSQNTTVVRDFGRVPT